MERQKLSVELKVVGVSFPNEDGTSRQDNIKEMTENEINNLTIQREPNNPYDTNAIMVLNLGKQIGYIGKNFASIIAPLIDQGVQFSVTLLDSGFHKNSYYCKIKVEEV